MSINNISINNKVFSNDSSLSSKIETPSFWSSIKKSAHTISKIVGNLSNFGRMNLWTFSQVKEISPYFSYMTILPAFSNSRIITGMNIVFSGIVAYAISQELAVLSKAMPTIEDRLQIDGALLLTSSVYSLINFIESARALKNIATNDSEERDNQSLLLKMSYLGLSGLYFLSNCATVNRYIQSVHLYYQLDNIQQRAVLQFQAPISKLSVQKSCNAVVIDNTIRYPSTLEEAELFVDKVMKDPSEDNFVMPVTPSFRRDESIVKLYEKCRVQAYAPKSLEEFARNLFVDSLDHFDSIDILYISGHANTDEITITTSLSLNKENIFPRSPLAQIINKSLSSNGQVFLRACNVGCGENSLASILSKSLPGKTITGSKALYYPLKIEADYDEENKKLLAKSYSIKSCFGPVDPTYNQMQTFHTPL